MNANELRQQFINEAAPAVLENYINTAKGVHDLNVDTIKMAKMWKLVEKLIVDASDVDSLQAKSTSDVVDMLNKGKISISDAMKLMEMLKLEQDINELPKLMETIKAIEAEM